MTIVKNDLTVVDEDLVEEEDDLTLLAVEIAEDLHKVLAMVAADLAETDLEDQIETEKIKEQAQENENQKQNHIHQHINVVQQNLLTLQTSLHFLEA